VTVHAGARTVAALWRGMSAAGGPWIHASTEDNDLVTEHSSRGVG
jgi:hypothetical protein